MHGAHEGDLVRPLGFVVLYAAYAEGELDDLIATLPADAPYDDRKRVWPLGAKVTYALELLARLESKELTDLRNILSEAPNLFSRRNELVHGRLFVGGRLVSNRHSQPESTISPGEIGQLADEIFNWKERLWDCRWRKLVPFLEASRSADDAYTVGRVEP